ncbi:MAG: hypothetical protein GC159_07545 [Phycisphaera sp.]|nr:hypothetical protein [Phycisphaera sp.]
MNCSPDRIMTPLRQVGERLGEGDGYADSAYAGETCAVLVASPLTPALSLPGKGSGRAADGRLTTLLLVGALMWSFCLTAVARGEDKKDEKKPEPPVLMVISPLAVSPDKKTMVTLRGLRLDKATEVVVKVGDTEIKPEIKNKGGVGVPNKFEAKEVGDQHVQVELTLPAEPEVDHVSITVTTPDGVTEPRELRVIAADVLVDEKEGNDGFGESQPLEPGKTFRGVIQHERDVDVFRVDGKAGQKWTFTIAANALGSPMDPALTLYDASGRLVARRDDDSLATRDCTLTVTLPADGVYQLGVIDSLDHGADIFSYLLTASVE